VNPPGGYTISSLAAPGVPGVTPKGGIEADDGVCAIVIAGSEFEVLIHELGIIRITTRIIIHRLYDLLIA
jgi:hypothetical protein